MARTIILDDYQEREITAILSDMGRAANFVADIAGLIHKNLRSGEQPFEDFSDPSIKAVVAMIDNAACRILTFERRAHDLLGTSADYDDLASDAFCSPPAENEPVSLANFIENIRTRNSRLSQIEEAIAK